MKMKTTRWILVDDDPGILELTGDLLEMIGGGEVSRFHSAAVALAAFAAAPEEIELVVTDLQMPGMDGVELCRRIRGLSPKAKVLLVSGNSWFGEVQAFRWGFNGFVSKPFSAQAMARAIEALGISLAGTENFLQPEAASLAA